jgi:hypothetical protein
VAWSKADMGYQKDGRARCPSSHDRKTNGMQVTCVLTSCGRFDLLERTLHSFFEFNTFPIKKFIIIEDSGYINSATIIKEMIDQLKIYKPPEFLVIENKHNIGQVKSIDWAYFHVETEYIFHMEDDWEFYAPGFIEESALIMQSNPWIITVSRKDSGSMADISVLARQPFD